MKPRVFLMKINWILSVSLVIVWKRGCIYIFKKFNFFLLKIKFLCFLDYFDTLILKIVFFK